MIRRELKKLSGILMLMFADVAALVLCFVIGYYLRAGFFVDVIPMFVGMQHSLEQYSQMWPILSLWILVFAFEGIYPSIGTSFWDETRKITRGNTLAFIVVVIFTFLTRTSFNFSRSVVFLSFICSLLFLPLSRMWMRSFLTRTGLWSLDVVLVGSNKGVSQVKCNLAKHPDWGLNAVGVIVPSKEDCESGEMMIGTIEDMERLNMRSDEVIIAMPGLSSVQLALLVEKSHRIAPLVKVVPDLYGLASAGVETQDLDGMLLLGMEDRLAKVRNRVVKRIFDFLASFLALVLLSPLFLVLAVLIKIDSRGPVFFGHRRVGKDGETFSCYKFRSMVVNAQEVLEELLENDPVARAEWEKDFKLKDDPRITRLGRFLRRTSLDELPQLFNVLRGDMSLVGPRPIIRDEVLMYGDKSKYFFRVIPGITGMWQVSGRNDIEYDERVLLDEYYAKNWSLWLDIEIILRTFGVIFKRQGAY